MNERGDGVCGAMCVPGAAGVGTKVGEDIESGSNTLKAVETADNESATATVSLTTKP